MVARRDGDGRDDICRGGGATRSGVGRRERGGRCPGDAAVGRASGVRRRSARRTGEAQSGAAQSGRAARCPDSGFKPLRRRGALPRGSGVAHDG
jgi:hypothetical protein